MTTTANAYRAASLEHASHLDLLLASYDALAQDLRLAGLAAEQGHIAERCRLSGHALLLVGHLESWTQLLHEPVLESSLADFYTFVRGELMRSQGSPSAAHFSNLALLVCEVRAAWQGKGSKAAAMQDAAMTKASLTAAHEESRVAFSFSA